MLDRILDIAREIHASNVRAGWWADLKTGQSILETRNRGEIMMLIVSEVSEADYGLMFNLKDDKLPHLPMYDVELADVAIRMLDLIGAELARGVEVQRPIDHVDATRNHPRAMLDLVNCVSRAMEHHRKGRMSEYLTEIVRGLLYLIDLAEGDGVNLWTVIEEKRGFNAQRADHKPENRLLEGGKAY